MKTKAKDKRKIGQVILISMGFLLAIVITFTTTLAWFYDSDWASKYINMAGTVGIQINKQGTTGDETADQLRTSGSGNLHFVITTDKAYPGQAVDVSASAYNNGGKSGEKGSECYLRAHFAVYTNTAQVAQPNPSDYVGGTASNAYKAAVAANGNSEVGINPNDYEDKVGGGTKAPAYIRDLEAYNGDLKFNTQGLYEFLHGLITQQNSIQSDYYWKYYQHTGALALSSSGLSSADLEYYIDGKKYKDASHSNETNTDSQQVENISQIKDLGYFYLCTDSVGVLKPLSVNSTAVFLWNDQFIIPWTLTNNSAGKLIFVGLTFQAIQTYIPKIENGIINSDANNRLPAEQCTYNSTAVQTVFSSCSFKPIDTRISVDGTIVDFSSDDYSSTSTPTA